MIAIDLGSNSLRCIEFDETRRVFGKECEFIVRTAENLHVKNTISSQAVKRIIDSLHEAKTILEFNKQKVSAVTTQALRYATNSDAVIQKIFQECGIQFEIIDAKKEAEYALKAVKFRLNSLGLNSKNFVLIDVGGGSTEIIFYKNGKIISKSFSIGIVTTAEQCKNNFEMNLYLEDLFIDVEKFINEIYEEHDKPMEFVATAGTPTTMAAYLNGMNYKNYDAKKINGYHLSLSNTYKVLEDLQKMSHDERKEHVGVGRESLIIAGIVIVQKLYKLLKFEYAVVIDDGVREGVALDYSILRKKAF